MMHFVHEVAIGGAHTRHYVGLCLFTQSRNALLSVVSLKVTRQLTGFNFVPGLTLGTRHRRNHYHALMYLQCCVRTVTNFIPWPFSALVAVVPRHHHIILT